MTPKAAGFVEWARRTGRPCDEPQALGELIGAASIVALGEAQHGAAEPLLFRNQLFEYLVHERGFTAIALESGIVEGRAIDAYVQGGGGDFNDVVTQGLSWGFERLPQNKALVRWLRKYNDERRGARKIRWYGFDIPGSPGNGKVTRGVDTGLREALRCLTRVDPEGATAIRRRVDRLLVNLRFDCRDTRQAFGYQLLDQADRDTLTAAIADLIVLLERQSSSYIAATSAAEYQLALRVAVGATQADTWLREVPVGWQPSGAGAQDAATLPPFLSRANEIRDRAQADNLTWIIEREGDRGKVFVYAHRYHASTAPVRVQWAPERLHHVMGTYLRQRYGDRLIAIGGLVGRGTVDCDGEAAPLEPPPESLDSIARALDTPSLLLDLRDAPARVAEWLDRKGVLGFGDDRLFLPLSKAFDALWYLDTVTPAQ